MPISKLQSDILRLIAAKRDPESFIAGGVPINRAGPRYWDDIDVFHDRQERVAEAARVDAAMLAHKQSATMSLAAVAIGSDVPEAAQQPNWS